MNLPTCDQYVYKTLVGLKAYLCFVMCWAFLSLFQIDSVTEYRQNNIVFTSLCGLLLFFFKDRVSLVALVSLELTV